MTERRSRRRGAAVLLLTGALLTVVMVGGSPPDPGTDYAPYASGPNGALALKYLLEAFEADVEIGEVVDPKADVLLVYGIELEDSQLRAARRFVEEGGRLVVVDPLSGLTPEAVPVGVLGGQVAPSSVDVGVCSIDALEGIESIEVGGGAFEFVANRQHDVCFGDGENGVIVAEPVGLGTQVSIGSFELFANGHLATADNAVVAVNLLAPEPGTRVHWLLPGSALPTADSLAELLSSGVWATLALLALAAVAYIGSKARRLGPPVVESRPVEREASELVAASGRLLQRTRQPNGAATILRNDLAQSLRRSLGLSANLPVAQVADVAADRLKLDPSDVLAVLDGPAVTDDETLLALSAEIHRIRQALRRPDERPTQGDTP